MNPPKPWPTKHQGQRRVRRREEYVQGARIINIRWEWTDRLIDQFAAYGIDTAELAENASEVEWQMAASLAGGMPVPDAETRKWVIERLSDREANPEPFACFAQEGGF